MCPDVATPCERRRIELRVVEIRSRQYEDNVRCRRCAIYYLAYWPRTIDMWPCVNGTRRCERPIMTGGRDIRWARPFTKRTSLICYNKPLHRASSFYMGEQSFPDMEFHILSYSTMGSSTPHMSLLTKKVSYDVSGTHVTEQRKTRMDRATRRIVLKTRGALLAHCSASPDSTCRPHWWSGI